MFPSKTGTTANINMKKSIGSLFLVILLCFSFLLGGCGKVDSNGSDNASDYIPFAKVSGSVCEIGHKNKQKWTFEKNGANWIFNGVYVKIGKKWEQIIDHKSTEMNGGLFKGYGISATSQITSVSTEEQNGEQVLTVKGSGFTAVFRAGDSPFIMRDIQMQFTEDVSTFEDMIRFSLLTSANKFEESGYIATRKVSESKLYLPYAFPAIFSTLKTSNYSVNVTDVVDWYNTHDAFKTASRQKNARGSFEIGLSTAIGDIPAGTIGIREYFKFDDASKNDFYSEVGDAYEQAMKINPLAVEQLTQLDNRAVSDWDVIAEGLVGDITDPRARNEKMLNATADYGYSDGTQWGSSFSTMNVANGFIRYAYSLGDEAMIGTAMDYALGMVREVAGKNWIEPTSFAPEGYFHYASQDYAFVNDIDGAEEGPTALSTWKYYDRVYKLGEIAEYTLNQELIDGFFDALPFVRALKTEDGYKQPVSFDLYTREPLTGYDGGGSAGATAMWSYINFLAYDLADENDPDKQTYFDDAVGAIDYASQLPFSDMRLMRDAPKPLAIAWVTRTCVKAYEMTGEKKFLERAEKVLDGLYFFFYNNTNPYTTFATNGWGYACSEERWENTLEMYGALKFITPYLQYTDNNKLLDLFAAAGYTYTWTIPVNGFPEGNPASRWDGIDGMYIGFEFPTGAQGDNPDADFGQSVMRQVKALYGSGEAFQMQQVYSAFAETLDKDLTVLCYSSVKEKNVKEENGFKLYNPTNADRINAIVRFKNLSSGNYVVTYGDKNMGVYSAENLNYGLKFSIGAGESCNISLKKTSESSSTQTKKAGNFTAKLAASNTSWIKFDTKSLPEADYFIVSSSPSDTFTECRKSLVLAEKMADFCETRVDNEKTYYKIEAVKDGALLSVSQVFAVNPVQITAMVQDDFSVASGWSVDNCGFKSDGFAGYMVPQNIDLGTSVLSKEFTVDLGKTPVFEFVPISKNLHSTWKVVLEINGKEIEAVPSSQFINQKTYRIDLSEQGSGTVTVNVKLIVSGRNRGFAMERIRFIGEKADGIATTIEKAADSGTYSNGILKLNTAGQAEDNTKATFDPQIYHTLYLKFDNARILDKVSVKIHFGEIEKTAAGRLTENKDLTLDLTSQFAGIAGETEVSFTCTIENDKAELVTMSLSGSGASESCKINSSMFDCERATLDDGGTIVSDNGYVMRGIWFNTLETPNLFLSIQSVSQGSNWSLKFYDGNENSDEVVLLEGNKAGTYNVKLADILGNDSIYCGELRLYVNGSVTAETFGYNRTIILSSDSVVTTSQMTLKFSGSDTSIYNSLCFHVAELTQGAQWRVFAKTEYGLTELRAPTERRYPIKYFRGKRGFFQYDLSALGTLGKEFEIVVMLSGNGAELAMKDIRLSSTNMVSTNRYIEVVA